MKGFLWLLTLGVLAVSVNASCSCLNEGICLPVDLASKEPPTCKCQPKFLGRWCQSETVVLLQNMATQVEVSTNFTLLSYQPDRINYYKFEFEVCVKGLVENLKNIIFVSIEQPNGTFEMAPTIDDVIILNSDPVCTTLDLSYLLFATKLDQTPERLIIGIRIGAVEYDLKKGEKKFADTYIPPSKEQVIVKLLVTPFFTDKMVLDWLLISICITGSIFLVCLSKFLREYYLHNGGTQRRCYRILRAGELPSFDQEIKSKACSICLATYENNDQLAITKCAHLFHNNCLSQWLESSFSCPLCRAPLEQETCLTRASLYAVRINAFFGGS